MTSQQSQEWRRARLSDLIDERFDGVKAELGRLLGYRDGSQIGQMLSGHRPITEKTIAKIEKLRGLAGWFSSTNAGPGAAVVPIPTQPQWPFGQDLLRRVNGLDPRWLGHLELNLIKAVEECERRQAELENSGRSAM